MGLDPANELEAEIALMRRMGQGDRESFAEFYRRFGRVLFSTIHRVLSSQEASEDVLQEVCLLIWEKAPAYDPTRGKPLTWAMMLARHRAIDRLRSLQRRERLREELQHEAETLEAFDDADSFSAAVLEENQARVRQALTRLGEDQRVALELAFFQAMTQSEIAEHLRQPLATVKARIRRGMMKLRDLLRERD